MLLEKRIDIPNDWYRKLEHYITSDKFTRLAQFIRDRRKITQVYPPSNEIFRAFQLTPFGNVRAVIIGMDPYNNLFRDKPVACGLSFAPRIREYMPPSLRQIYNCIKAEFYAEEMTYDVDLDIEYWAHQGVLMLNAALTVEAGKAGSHIKAWSDWTSEVIKAINEYSTGVVFCLWGKDAQAFESQIGSHHIILKNEHPVAANYQGRKWECDHFRKINEHLMGANGETIEWIKV